MGTISEKHGLAVALVGCGAVSEHCHLPALLKNQGCHVAALVDSNRSRVEQLAARYRVSHAFTDYQDLYDLRVDAAIVALPNNLHAPVTIDLLRRGIHVLVEKPMALTVAECDAMIETASETAATLAVGLTRRFYRSGQLASSLVQKGVLGKILSFDFREGRVFNWPLASDFFFRKVAAGGGVLIDTGVHTLDQLLWSLGDGSSFEYFDDNFGGVEADCEIHLKLKSGVQGTVQVSRTRNLRNTAIICGERGELEVALTNDHVALRLEGIPAQVMGQATSRQQPFGSEQVRMDPIVAEHEDFLESVRNQRAPFVSGFEGRRSVALIEACYRDRKPLSIPWMDGTPALVGEVV
jgi:predicted dehydrogenase